MYELIFYTTARGDSPVDKFLDSLPRKHRAKAERVMMLLKLAGPDLTRPYADTLRGKIRELRAAYGCLQMRFLYFFNDKQIVIVSGFLKKTSAIPEAEITRAERRLLDWRPNS